MNKNNICILSSDYNNGAIMLVEFIDQTELNYKTIDNNIKATTNLSDSKFLIFNSNAKLRDIIFNKNKVDFLVIRFNQNDHMIENVSLHKSCIYNYTKSNDQYMVYNEMGIFQTSVINSIAIRLSHYIKMDNQVNCNIIMIPINTDSIRDEMYCNTDKINDYAIKIGETVNDLFKNQK